MIVRDFDAVIFDCDGTLVDSEPITVRTLVEFVKEFGLELDYDEALGLFLGRDMQLIVEVLEGRIGKKLPDDFTETYRRRQAAELRRSVECVPGAEKLLASMTKPFCIASNAPVFKINLNLKVTGIAKFFEDDLVLSAYDIKKWKPDPALFFYAAEKLKVDPTRCVVIEDSLAGIEAGLAAGMQTVGYSPTAEAKPTDSVPFVHSLLDLIPVLC